MVIETDSNCCESANEANEYIVESIIGDEKFIREKLKHEESIPAWNQW